MQSCASWPFFMRKERVWLSQSTTLPSMWLTFPETAPEGNGWSGSILAPTQGKVLGVMGACVGDLVDESELDGSPSHGGSVAVIAGNLPK